MIFPITCFLVIKIGSLFMNLGSRNKEFQYTMGGQELKTSEFEKDIGVLIQTNLKPTLQCAKAAKTANAVLAQIARPDRYISRQSDFSQALSYLCEAAFRILFGSVVAVDKGRQRYPGKCTEASHQNRAWIIRTQL